MPGERRRARVGAVLTSVIVRIEDTTPPRGQVVTPDGVTRPFVGWLALIRLLDAPPAAAGRPSGGAAPTGPQPQA